MDRNSESIIAGRILAMPRADYQTRGMDPSSAQDRVTLSMLSALAYSTRESLEPGNDAVPPHSADDKDPNVIAHLWVA